MPEGHGSGTRRNAVRRSTGFRVLPKTVSACGVFSADAPSDGVSEKGEAFPPSGRQPRIASRTALER